MALIQEQERGFAASPLAVRQKEERFLDESIKYFFQKRIKKLSPKARRVDRAEDAEATAAVFRWSAGGFVFLVLFWTLFLRAGFLEGRNPPRVGRSGKMVGVCC